jgi:cardiolipin-specific phospholipase
LSQVPGYRLFSIDWLGMGRSSRPKWTLSKRSCQTWDEIVDNVSYFYWEDRYEEEKHILTPLFF